MVITWYGQSCFKIQSGNLTVAVDPFSKETGATAPRFKSDIVIVSHGHSHLQKDSIPENPIVIKGPGEYEAQGVLIHGIQTYHDDAQGKELGLNTAYSIGIEDMNVVHLGDFGESTVRPEVLEALGTVDILLIPVGGHPTIDAKTAKKIIEQIEPRVVIPMNYKTSGMKGSLDTVDTFLKEMGAKNQEAEDRFTIKKKDLPQAEETKVIVLKAE